MKGEIKILKNREMGGMSGDRLDIKSNHFKHGFVLIELAVVILLLGFILLLCVPRIREMIGPADIQSAVRGLAGTVRYVQSQAATTKQRHRLVLDLSENTFWVSVEGEPGKYQRDEGLAGKPRRLPAAIHFMDFRHAQRGKAQEGSAYIEFSPTGWAEECTIHLRRGAEEIFTIFIHPLGGKVEVAPGYQDRVKG